MRETNDTNRKQPVVITTADASWLKGFVILAMALAMLAAIPAHANQWSLLINGKAVHLDEQPGVEYNEENWGLGVQYDFPMTPRKWVPFVNASVFDDSNKNLSYYAGGGAARRFALGRGDSRLHLDAGLVAFLMVRKDFNSGNPFPGVLPVVSIGTERLAVNVSYIPKIDPKMVPIVFFQLKIGLN